MTLNSRDQSKWDALQAANSATIEKILQGSATPDDIRLLSRVIAQQSALAGRVFDEAITGAETTADTIVDRLNRERVAGGKRPLTIKAQERIYKQTLQRVMQESSEDILGSVHDQLDEQTQQIEDHIDDAFDRVRRESGNLPDNPRTLSQRIALLSNQLQSMGARGGQNLVVGIRRIATPSRSDLEGDLPPDQAGPNPLGGSDRSTRMGITTFIRTSISSMRDAVVDGWRNITSGNQDDEDQRATTWLRKLKGFFGDMKDRAGSAASKTKSLLEKIFGPIGKVLLLALTNPQLIATITAAISKYLNFDTISDFVETTWKDIKTGGSDIIDWIIAKVKGIFGGGSTEAKKAAANSPNTAAGKAAIATSIAKDSQIPASTTITDARAAIPEIESKIKATTAALGRAKERLAKDPSDDNKISVRNNTIRLQILQGQLDNYRRVLGAPTAKPADTKTTAMTVGADSTAGMPTSEQARTSVTAGPASPSSTSTAGPTGPSPAAVNANSSTQAIGTFPKFKDGITIDNIKTEDLEVKNSKGKDAMASAGIVSLKSFGFNSGDDTLNLLNMGLIG